MSETYEAPFTFLQNHHASQKVALLHASIQNTRHAREFHDSEYSRGFLNVSLWKKINGQSMARIISCLHASPPFSPESTFPCQAALTDEENLYLSRAPGFPAPRAMFKYP